MTFSSARLDVTPTALAWIALYAVILGAWVLLFAATAQHASEVPLDWLGPGMSWLAPLIPSSWRTDGLPPLLSTLCLTGPGAGDGSPLVVLHMWALMTLAMMLPTALPVIATYRELTIDRGREGIAGIPAFIGGYMLIWLGFAVVAAAAQVALARQDLIDIGGRTSLSLAAALLIAAGAYQLTPWKAMCLAHCRSPMMTLMANWRAGVWGALRMGAQNGLFCLGCCWALMLLAFVGGTMNLVWMGIATVLMALEKLPRIGRYLTLPLAVVLLSAGAVLLLLIFSPTA
jgi:predicted metal-binding membrane protein